MIDAPRTQLNKKEVVQAGEALRGVILWSDEQEERIKRVFRTANAWRESHLYPMTKVRHELMGRIRATGARAITVARLKRLSSVRKKLQRTTLRLDQIQDLGGCRAIAPSIAAVRDLLDDFRTTTPHTIYKEDDYILCPKPDGYRSHHVLVKFQGSEDTEAFSGRRIELQIRTRLQHSWATAVEAIGLFRGEDLKAGEGDKDWLRLLNLMSAEFALAEGCEPAGGLTQTERQREARELEKSLRAFSTLEALRQAVRYTETFVKDVYAPPEYFLVQYDMESREVVVSTYSQPINSVISYDSAEQLGRQRNGALKSVLVEADKIETLKEAYPHYFGDVRFFQENLMRIVEGKDAVEFTMRPQESVRVVKPARGDLGWLRRYTAGRRNGR